MEMAEHGRIRESSFDKLSESNYSTWSENMRHRLMYEDLWGIVKGTVIQPTDGEATNEEKQRFETKKSKAFALIALCISDSQKFHIHGMEDPNLAWTKLDTAFKGSSMMKMLALWKEFTQMRLESNETMSAYLGRFEKCTQQLQDIEEPIKELYIALSILSGLPEDYDNIAVQFNTIDHANLKVSDVRHTLITEDGRRAARRGEQSSNALSTHSCNKNQKPMAASQKKSGSQSSPQSKPAHTKFTGKCFRCGKIGHKAPDCKTKVPDAGKQKIATPLSACKQQSSKEGHAGHIAMNASSTPDSSWIVDSSATDHFCNCRDWMRNYRTTESKKVSSAHGHTTAVGIGEIWLHLRVKNKVNTLRLQDVIYIPELKRNLLSVGRNDLHGLQWEMRNGNATVRDENGTVFGTAKKVDGLYILDAKTVEVPHEEIVRQNHHLQATTDIDVWHKRFCHVNYSDILKLSQHEMVRGIPKLRKSEDLTCNDCKIGKSTKAAHPSIGGVKVQGILDLVHGDVWGPAPTMSIGGGRYFATFVDEYSRKLTVYILKSKSDVQDAFHKFRARAERESGRKIKRFRSDNGLEYCNVKIDSVCEELGIRHELTNTYSPQMNGVAERVNRTIMDLVMTILQGAELPNSLWAEAVFAVVHVKNRSPHSAINECTPLERWSGRKPSVAHLKIYGCLAFMHVPKQKRKDKLSPRAEKMILVGYADTTRGYRLWRPGTNQVEETKHVTFDESTLGTRDNRRQLAPSLPLGEENDIQIGGDATAEDPNQLSVTPSPPESSTSEKPEIETSESEGTDSDDEGGIKETLEPRKRKPGRPRKKVKNPWGRSGNPAKKQTAPDRESPPVAQFFHLEVNTPETVEQALSMPQAEEWQRAIDVEIENHRNHNTWTPATLPPGRKAIGSRWVFATKIGPTGEIVKYKARVVAKGFSQRPGVDFDETYSPVVNFSLIRMLIPLVTKMGWHTGQLDVNCAYLYGTLEEEIYMAKPPGCKEDGQVLRLNKSLYGLKQAGRTWYDELNCVLHELGFTALASTNCIYTMGNSAILLVYVDDVAIFGKNEATVETVKKLIASKFQIKDLGEIKFLLGVEFCKEADGSFSIGQEAYVRTVLERFSHVECRSTSTPMDPGIKLSSKHCPQSEDEQSEMSKVPYRNAIGALSYLAQRTRPDLMFATTKLSQYNSNPGPQHWKSVKHLLRYLSSTKKKKIYFTDDPDPLTVYTDSDWASDIDTRHSFSGSVITLGRTPIAWCASKQKCVTLSSIEAEYVALSEAVRSAVWTTRVLEELNLKEFMSLPTTVYCDNRAAIDFSANRVENSRTKHIDVRYHFSHDKVREGIVKLQYIPTTENLADIFTKITSGKILKHLCEKMNVR